MKIRLDNHNENAEVLWKPSRAFAKHKDSISASHDTLQPNASWQMNGGEAHIDLRRTRFGQLVEAVNAAKDIVYAIWNVGWQSSANPPHYLQQRIHLAIATLS